MRIFLRFAAFCALACSVAVLAPRTGTARDIVLGMSAAFTGPSRGLGLELYRGAMAYFDFVNRNGGIDGRKIRILALDDAYEPAQAVKNTLRLLKNKDVFCLFNYVGTSTVTRMLPLLNTEQARGKLFFFPLTGAQPQRKYPYTSKVFNLRASYRQEMQALVNEFSLVGRRRIAIFFQNDAYGRCVWDGVRRALRTHRLDLVGEATYRRGATFEASMAEQVDIIARQQPEAIIAVGSYEACAAFIRDARNAGVRVPIANLSFSGNESLLKLLIKAGSSVDKDYTRDLIFTQVVPDYMDRTLPAARLYTRLMIKNPPKPPDSFGAGYEPFEFGFVSFEGYLNAVVMTHILRLHHARPETPLAEVVEGVRDFDAGIDVTISFGPERHQGLNRVYFTTVVDDGIVPIEPEEWRRWSR